MPVERYRSVEAMPLPWRPADDPNNLLLVARMIAAHLRLAPPSRRGVQRFRTLEEANAERADPYRSAPSGE